MKKTGLFITVICLAGCQSADEQLRDALKHNDATKVQAALDAGADPCVPGPDGTSPMFAATAGDHVELATMMADKANFDATDKDGATVTHIAVRNKNKKLFKLYLEKGAKAFVKDNDGNCQLHWAAGWGDAEVVELLLANGTPIDETNNDGETPLYQAVQSNSLQAVELLLTKGAKPDVATTGGETPLYEAVYRGHADIAAMLIKVGSNPTKKNKEGQSPAELAAEKGGDMAALFAPQ